MPTRCSAIRWRRGQVGLGGDRHQRRPPGQRRELTHQIGVARVRSARWPAGRPRPRRPRVQVLRTRSFSRSPSRVRGLCRPGRVDQHQLGVRPVHDAADGVPGRLRLGGRDGDLAADQRVGQRGLAGVRAGRRSRRSRSETTAAQSAARRHLDPDGRATTASTSQTTTSVPGRSRSTARSSSVGPSAPGQRHGLQRRARPEDTAMATATGHRREVQVRQRDAGRGVGAAVGVADAGALPRPGPGQCGAGQGDDLDVLVGPAAHVARASSATSGSRLRCGSRRRCRSDPIRVTITVPIRFRRPLGALGDQLQAVVGDHRAGDGHLVQQLGHQPADRLHVLVVQLETEQVAQLVERKPGGDPVAARRPAA